jgi:hypothetical protein
MHLDRHQFSGYQPDATPAVVGLEPSWPAKGERYEVKTSRCKDLAEAPDVM